MTEDAIRTAEAQVLMGSGSAVDSAQALAAIGAARALAARGQAVAARILAEQAAEGVGSAEEAFEEPSTLLGPPADPEEFPGTPEEEPQMTYQDGSNDPAASFQYATPMTPGQAAIMVPNHEQGHVIHAYSEAMVDGREVVGAYTRVFYRMDWRTGRMVPAGGQAVVMTRAERPAKLPFPEYA
jgi:hypothetical protein